MARELRSALDGDQFYLVYQEQRCAKTEKVVGYEALLRWDHPERGAVPPGHFMPIAEESGAILPIGAWALRKACQQAVASNVEEKIAVNVSPMQLADAELANTVLEALVGTGLSPQRLEIEVTESAIIKDKRRALKTLRELRSKGYRSRSMTSGPAIRRWIRYARSRSTGSRLIKASLRAWRKTRSCVQFLEPFLNSARACTWKP
jgi:EAL domain-containing protein (putative c-di-GMP-specific phosphodiesterase class I)